jgi:hypothetical protein
MSVSVRFALGAIAIAGLLLRPSASGQGLTPEWEVRKSLTVLLNQVKSLLPLLANIKPGQWREQSAAQAYQQQLGNLRDELGYLERNLAALVEKPDSMKMTLEVFLRLQHTDTMMVSVIEGEKRYGNAFTAEQLQEILSRHASTRTELRNYLVELVSAKEEELRIADAEAQRCQSILVRQPGARRQ